MWGSTPLIVALQYGQKEIAEILLQENELGDLDHSNEKGASALLYACMEGMTDIVSAQEFLCSSCVVNNQRMASYR
jgi:ankyrin repeat protein